MYRVRRVPVNLTDDAIARLEELYTLAALQRGTRLSPMGFPRELGGICGWVYTHFQSANFCTGAVENHVEPAGPPGVHKLSTTTCNLPTVSHMATNCADAERERSTQFVRQSK